MKPTTVSLFCGAGGESAGKELAFRDLGIDTRDWTSHAINHWDLAVATHGANFPGIQVHQEDITKVTAATFGVSEIDLLWASPSCVHHSRARGGKPCEDQQRSHADEVVDRWLKVAKVSVLLIENVPEFEQWGPLDAKGQPIKERKGEYFRRFAAKLVALGYRVEYRVLCAADYGDPTTRRRFFLQAVRDGISIVWPEATHRDPRRPADMFSGHLPVWRTAAECIDWSIPCPSIFDRRKPLAEATLRRIAAGVMRYVVQAQRPFLVNLTHGGRLEDLDEPLKTVTGANRGEKAIVVPSLVGVGGRAGQSRPRSADEPLGVLTTKADGALVAGFLSSYYGAKREGEARGADMESPLPTQPTANRHALVAAHMMSIDQQSSGDSALRPADAPLSTATTKARHALIAASLMTNTTGHAPTGVDAPVPALTTGNHQALVAAFISHYYGQGTTAQDPGQPLHTITTLARHGLVTVEIDGETYVITDIGMRMLEPRELARAMGFPEDFRFVNASGMPLTKRDTVKMIGNACPVHTVCELIKSVVLQRPAVFGAQESIA